MDFHLRKAFWSKCPRRKDFNSLLYIKFCHEDFVGKNGAEMFDKRGERINELTESKECAKISYQLFNRDYNSAFLKYTFTK